MRCRGSGSLLGHLQPRVAGIAYLTGADPANPGPGRRLLVVKCPECGHCESWFEDRQAPSHFRHHEER